MSENGNSHRKNLVSEILDLLDEHIELASLEWQYEKNLGLRRIIALCAALILVITAYVLFQFALVHALGRLGLSFGQSCAALGMLYILMGIGLVWIFGRRDPRIGRPFHGTRAELRKNLRWIQNLFS